MNVDYTLNDYSIRLYVPDQETNKRYFHQIGSEQDVLEQLLDDVNEDDIFFDIGANLGLYSCFIGSVVSSVVAFEPHPNVSDLLRKNIELNEITADVRKIAIGNEEKEVILNLHDIPGMSHLEMTNPEDNNLGKKVRMETVDSISGDITRSPSIIKIDVEGAELSVVEGMESTLRNGLARVIYIEIHPRNVIDWGLSEQEIKELQDRLKDCGYECNIIREEQNGTKHLRAILSRS